MKNIERIPDNLFNEKGHYLGKPAEFSDKIVSRRINLVNSIPNFAGKAFTLLDIGCGNGSSMFELHSKMKYCVGLDITTEHLDKFQSIVIKNKIENCFYRLQDIERTIPIEQFDRIISFEVIEHLQNENSVSYYYKSLKEDGIMAISVPNKWWIFETHGVKNSTFPWNRVPFFSWLPRSIHEKFANARIYSKRRITKLLEYHGFTVISARYITAPMDVLPSGKFKDLVVRYFFNSDITRIPFKSTSIFIVAKKRA